MKRIVAAIGVLLLFVGPALAGAPSAAQKEDFYRTCMGIAQDQALCTCKADAATRLIDAGFMDLVIASMKGKAPPSDSYVAYNAYVAKSNQICKPGY